MYTTAICNCSEQVQAIEGGVFRLPMAVVKFLWKSRTYERMGLQIDRSTALLS